MANLHAHGRAWKGLTNGRQSDADVVQAYRSRGYDVAGISDYFQISAHSGVQTIALYEHGLNIGKHHQLAIGATDVVWFDLPLWQGVNQKQYVINRVKASAALVAIAHPSIMPVGYSPADLAQLTGYQLFELVNGRFTSEGLWDTALSMGHAVWAIGDDDTHDVTDPDRMAVAWNMIDAPSAGSDDIIAALGAGRSYAVSKTDGVPDRTDARLSSLSVNNGVVTVTCSAPATISFVGQHGRMLATVEDTSVTSHAFAPKDSYIRTVIRTPHTVMYLNPVFRYEDDRNVPAATIDEPKTWAMRVAMVLACAALLLSVWRRRDRWAAIAPDRSSLKRASSFVIMLAAAIMFSASAQAQTSLSSDRPAVGEGPPLGSTLTFDLLRDLPTSDNLFSILETTQAEVISDRFSGGGLNFGTSARVGAFGSSWTQTIYRIGDVDVTDGGAAGAPLFFPEVAWWERVSLASGLMPADLSAPGATISLEPRKPSGTWTREAELSSSFGDGLTAHGGSLAVPIATAAGWNHASVVASGPIVANRLGLFFAGSWTGTSQRERGGSTRLDANVGSAFAHLLFTPKEREEISVVGILQRDDRPEASRQLFAVPAPSRRDFSGHVQATWARRGDNDRGWRGFISFTQRSSTSTAARLIDPIVDRVAAASGSVPPVQDLVDIGDRTDRRLTLGGRFAVRPGGGAHALHLGADVTGIGSSIAPGFEGLIGETVDGVPARLWDNFAGTSGARRAARTLAAYAEDRIEVSPRLTVSGALRYEWLGGNAENAASRVRWNTLLPHADVQWLVMKRFNVRAFGGYARAAYTLPVDALAWGDPGAPVAAVSPWTGPSTGRNPFVPAGPAVLWGPGRPRESAIG